MAESIHLYLKANGEDIQGESTQVSLGRENSIECVEFKDAVRTAREHGSRMAVGRRVHEPIVVVKRIDKSSPLLARALCNNENVAGTFKFFRPTPTGDGTAEHFYTIEFTDGRIDSIVRHSPNAFDPAESKNPPLETISFVFGTITWTYEPTGASHHDSWRDS